MPRAVSILPDSWRSATPRRRPTRLANPRNTARTFPAKRKQLSFLIERGSDGQPFTPPYLVWVEYPDREASAAVRAGSPPGCRCPVIFRVPAEESVAMWKFYEIDPPPHVKPGNGYVCYCNGRIVE